MKIIKQIFISFFLASSIIACKHDIPPASNGDICFETEILPIFNSKCATSGCHSGSNPAHGMGLSTYAELVGGHGGEGIIPYKPNESEFIEVMLEDDPDKVMPPPGSAPLTADELSRIIAWVNEGAPNTVNCASATCDSSLFLFNTHVLPIFESNCVGCHSGAEPDGGYDFSSYAGVKASVDEGRLLGAIQHLTDYSAMPPSPSPKLDACNLAKVRKWVQNGAVNN